MNYPTNEVFYSLIGEGQWVGTPAVFIRLAGCNLRCEFCDTDHSVNTLYGEEELLKEVMRYPCQRVVITGGEPFIHDLKPLCYLLEGKGYYIHFETNGTFPHPDWVEMFWVACSPKTNAINAHTVRCANELKFMVGQPDWEDNIEDVMGLNPIGLLYLTPIADKKNILDQNVQLAIDYCMRNPDFSLCMQMHKILHLR